MTEKQKKNNPLIGNKNARKKEGEYLESIVYVRAKRSDKTKWVAEANARGLKLSKWAVKILNKEIVRANKRKGGKYGG